MSNSPQTALLQLIDSYLQDLRHEAETLAAVARLITQSMENRRVLMAEIEAHFASRRPQIAAGASYTTAGVPPQAPQGWPASGRAGAERTDTLLHDLDQLMAQPPPQQSRPWAQSYHS